VSFDFLQRPEIGNNVSNTPLNVSLTQASELRSLIVDEVDKPPQVLESSSESLSESGASLVWRGCQLAAVVPALMRRKGCSTGSPQE